MIDNRNNKKIEELKVIANSENRIFTKHLIELVSPHDCQQVFQTIIKDKERYLGVVFDWSLI